MRIRTLALTTGLAIAALGALPVPGFVSPAAAQSSGGGNGGGGGGGGGGSSGGGNINGMDNASVYSVQQPRTHARQESPNQPNRRLVLMQNDSFCEGIIHVEHDRRGREIFYCSRRR